MATGLIRMFGVHGPATTVAGLLAQKRPGLLPTRQPALPQSGTPANNRCAICSPTHHGFGLCIPVRQPSARPFACGRHPGCDSPHLKASDKHTTITLISSNAHPFFLMIGCMFASHLWDALSELRQSHWGYACLRTHKGGC